jgi:plasmid maintenance system antidote protein VapI
MDETPIKAAAALGGSAESWLGMQAAYNLWHAAKKRRPKIEKIERAH